MRLEVCLGGLSGVMAVGEGGELRTWSYGATC